MTIGHVTVGETRVFIVGYGTGLVTGIQPSTGTGRTFQPGRYVITLDHDGSKVVRTYYDLLPVTSDTGERSEPRLFGKED